MPRQLLAAVRQLVVPFVRDADDAAAHRSSGRVPRDADGCPRNVLVHGHRPADLAAKLKLVLPDEGQGREGLLAAIQKVLKYSVNTWDQGFLDKLYASNTPVRSPPPPSALCHARAAHSACLGRRHRRPGSVHTQHQCASPLFAGHRVAR